MKQALTKRLAELKPDGMTERNVLFQSVVAGKGMDGTYPFKVTMTIRDYGAGYPANRYFGETCVANIVDGYTQAEIDFDMDLLALDVFGNRLLALRNSERC